MTNSNGARGASSQIVPPRVVHTSVVFVVLAITGVAVLIAGSLGAVAGPGDGNIPGWAGLGIVYGVLGTVIGCVVAPSVIRIARHDRIALATVRSSCPNALIMPGAGSNRELISSLRALGSGPSKPKSYLLSSDSNGLSVWQFDSATPILTIQWAEILSMETGSMTQGRATIAVAKLSLSRGRLLTVALRRRFGGISLMNQDKIHDVLAAFAAQSR
ncbi:MAG: hypothetical protein JWQ19_223 [Subtercola sp.]|nr:hypothetical protein [Subtercola sp.]